MSKLNIEIKHVHKGMQVVLKYGTAQQKTLISYYRSDHKLQEQELVIFYVKSFMLMHSDRQFSIPVYLNSMLCFPRQHNALKECFEDFYLHLAARTPLVVSLNTLSTYNQTRLVLGRYLSYLKDEELPLTIIDDEWCERFNSYLLSHEGYAINTARMHNKHLKKFMDHAVDHEWIRFNGIRKYKAPLEIKKFDYLTLEEVNRLVSLNLTQNHLQLTREVFLIMCFTGLAYADVSKLNSNHLKRSGRSAWIELSRQKTGTRCIIPLLPQASHSIKKAGSISFQYKGRKQDGLFPVHHIVNFNVYLKEIISRCGIDKLVTSHTARRTFASSISFAHGASLHTIAKMLGHAHITQTSGYAVVSDEKIRREMRLLNP